MAFGWINAVNAVIVAVLVANSVIGQKKRGLLPMKSRFWILNLVEQISRYACMALMILPLRPGFKFGFATIGAMLVWAALSLILLIVYVLLWGEEMYTAVLYALAVLPALLFLVSGYYLRHWALMAAAVLFGVCHTLIVRETLHRKNPKAEPDAPDRPRDNLSDAIH